MIRTSKAQSASSLTVLFMAVIIVSIFSIGAIMYMDGGTTTYGTTYDDTVFRSVELDSSINNLTLSTQQTLVAQNGTGAISGGGIINTITTAGFQSFSLISNIPNMLLSMFAAVAIILGIPAPIIMLLFSAVVVMIIGIIILLVFRVRV